MGTAGGWAVGPQRVVGQWADGWAVGDAPLYMLQRYIVQLHRLRLERSRTVDDTHEKRRSAIVHLDH